MSVWEDARPFAPARNLWVHKEKTKAMRVLDEAQIPYVCVRVPSEEGIYVGLRTAQKMGIDPTTIFRTVLARSARGRVYVFVIPLGARLDVKKGAQAVFEKRIELVSGLELARRTGYVRETCTPIGMSRSYPTVIDSHAEEMRNIVIGSGSAGSIVQLSVRHLAQVVKASFAPLTHPRSFSEDQ